MQSYIPQSQVLECLTQLTLLLAQGTFV